MGCPNSNNPQGLKCATEYRRFAQIGEKSEGSWSHNSTGTIKFNGVTLFSRTRKAAVSWVSSGTATDAVSCQMAGIGFDYYFFATNYTDQQFTCTIKEQQDIINNEILFTDLRHNIMVRKETTYSFTKDVTSTQAVLWNFGNLTKNLHKITPNDLDITVTERIYLNADIVDERTYPLKSEIDYTIALPPSSGMPQNNEQENYYLWYEHRDADGGLDLYYPDWLKGLSKTTVSIDDANKTRHLRLTKREGVQSSYAINSTDVLAPVLSGVNGSWAVSPTLVDGNNLRVSATLKLDGETFEVKLTPEQEDSTLFDTATRIPFPITPL